MAVTKITFTGKGKYDYIKAKDYMLEPKKGVSKEEFEEIGERHHWRGREVDKISRTKTFNKNPHLIKKLLNRDFEFQPHKINVLFGPNGSGKSTILKAIAAYSMCGDRSHFDGFTSLTNTDPIYIFPELDSHKKELSDEEYIKRMNQYLENKSGNQATIEWDGNPVYYENLASRNSNVFGNMTGSLIADGKEEFMYLYNKSRTSAGQHSLWMLDKLIKIIDNAPRPQDLIQAADKQFDCVNDIWQKSFSGARQYYDSHYNPSSKFSITVLLDELDKSLDITNVIYMYTEIFPAIMKKYPVQFILVSHSPLMMSNQIKDNELYNIISINDKYTKMCQKLLKQFTF